MRGDGKSEPNLHPARVALDRRVEKAFDTGELDDLVEPADDLCPAHPEDRPVEEDILATRQLRMEACSDLQQRTDATAQGHLTLARLGDARQNFQERGLAGAVPADQP